MSASGQVVRAVTTNTIISSPAAQAAAAVETPALLQVASAATSMVSSSPSPRTLNAHRCQPACVPTELFFWQHSQCGMWNSLSQLQGSRTGRVNVRKGWLHRYMQVSSSEIKLQPLAQFQSWSSLPAFGLVSLCLGALTRVCTSIIADGAAVGPELQEAWAQDRRAPRSNVHNLALVASSISAVGLDSRRKQ